MPRGRVSRHGHATRSKGLSLTYKSYKNMLTRCRNPKRSVSKNYVQRGISICERWLGDRGFEMFLDDMGERPSRDLSLDRIDNYLGYSPGNCRWATADQQSNNRRTSILLTVDGVRETVPYWAEKYGIRPTTIRYRKWVGWSDEDAVKRRVKPWKTYAACGGEPSSSSHT